MTQDSDSAWPNPALAAEGGREPGLLIFSIRPLEPETRMI